MSEVVTYGRVAYEAYSAAVDGRSLILGDPLPSWDELPEPVQVAWNKSGAAVCDAILADGLHRDSGEAL